MLVSINGVTVPAEQATVSVFDRGFLFGDAVFEAVRTWDRRPFHLDAHLDRLERSGDGIDLDVRPLRGELEAEVGRLVAAHPGDGELLVRLMVTRGASPDLDLLASEGPPVRVVWVKPLPPFPARLVERGLRLASIEPDAIVGRVSPGVKSNNRAANVTVHRLARARGFDDGLFVDPSGFVTEGPTWNLFLVREGRVVTPPLERGILEGITRGLVLGLCPGLGLAAEERPVRLDEARAADEAFITSTTRGVMPVAALDDRELPAPGPVTRRLRDALLDAR